MSYKIDDKCVRCTECVAHFNAGCYMKVLLQQLRGIITWLIKLYTK